MNEHFIAGSRLLSETFAQYEDTFVAFCELVNNSIQAGSKEIKITIDQVPSDEISQTVFRKLTILDNGCGVSASDFKERLLKIATDVKNGGKGIGRFAALQLGSSMKIETVAYDTEKKHYTKTVLPCSFDITRNQLLEDIKLNVTHEDLKNEHETYYQVTIWDFHDEQITKKEKHRKITKSLLVANISENLFQRYPLEIANKKVLFLINGRCIDSTDYLIGEIEKTNNVFVDSVGNKHSIGLSFLNYKAKKPEQRVFLRVQNNNIMTVGYDYNLKYDIPDENSWYIYVDSGLFDQKTDFFRNIAIKDMHNEEENLIDSINGYVRNFFLEKFKDYYDFANKLKNDEHYPYRNKRPSSLIKERTFNQISYFIESEYHLLRKREPLKKVIYPLIDKAISNGDLQELLANVLNMKDETVKKFKNLLEKTDIEDVIEFAERIASKSQFLDFLYNIVYGKPAEHLLERKQLHKIVERHLWIFGEQYKDTPVLFSDKNLKNNLIELRNDIFKFTPDEDEGNYIELENDQLRDITDLFFYNSKPTDSGEMEVMIIELKAPCVKISQKELSQIDKYMFGIEQRAVFSKSLRFKIILISSDLTSFGRSQVGKEMDRFFYKKSKTGNIESHVMSWADLITHNQNKLSYLGEYLRTKDIDIKEIFDRDYSEIDISNLQPVLI